MTAEEFESMAVKLFQRSTKKQDFNPIIDAAKELAASKISIDNVDPNLLTYTLMYLKGKYNHVRLSANETVTCDLSHEELTVLARKEVAEIFLNNPETSRDFNVMVSDVRERMRRDRAKNITQKTIYLIFFDSSEISSEITMPTYEDEKASIAIAKLAKKLARIYISGIENIMDQFLG